MKTFAIKSILSLSFLSVLPLSAQAQPSSAYTLPIQLQRDIQLISPAPLGVSYSSPPLLTLKDPRSLLTRGLQVYLDGHNITGSLKPDLLPHHWTTPLAQLKSGTHRLKWVYGPHKQTLSFEHQTLPLKTRLIQLGDGIVEHFQPSQLGWDWGEGLLLYALARLDQRLGVPRYRPFIEAYYTHHLAQGLPLIDWSDKCAPGLAALELYKATGEAKYKAIGEKIVTYLKNAQPTASGGLNHMGTWWVSGFYPQSVWVDSLMMYNIFAARWGQTFRDRWLTDFSAQQPLDFAQVLQHPDTHLWKHAWFSASNEWMPQQDIYWLRGNGWALASIPEVLRQLPPDQFQRTALINTYTKTAESLRFYQHHSGLWFTLLNQAEFYLETSGSALVAYGLLQGINDGYLSPAYTPVAEKALFAVLDRLENRHGFPSMPGISDSTMPYETLGYSLVPQRKDKPYGLAALILAALEYDRKESKI